MNENNLGYSIENAKSFEWSSITGRLNPERVSHLDRHIVGRKILDAGCGGGGYVEYLAARGFDVTGVDFHTEFLPSGAATLNGNYLQGDITSLPFPAAHFDTTFCYDVLEHVDDFAALRELVRVTRSKLILAVPATDQNEVGFGLTFRHYQDLTHLRTYTTASLIALLKSTGLKRFEVFPELAVDLRAAAIHHLDNAVVGVGLREKSRLFYHKLLRRLLARARYRTIHSGLVAIINVDYAANN